MKTIHYNILAVFICSGTLILGGCGYGQNKKTLEEVLRIDPAFKEVMAKKEALDTTIGDLQSKVRLKKKEIEKDMQSLRKGYSQYKNDVEKKIKEAHAGFAPYITAVEFEKEDIEAQLKAKKSKVQNLKNMLKELNALAARPSESEDWTRRISEVEQQIAQLKGDITSLEYSMKIIRMKLSLLESER
ncbi:MAG: hypothetical protein JW844_04920 [Candidatus Omnitrophica bacterium]|nr:hypothetical protein [Candidatus Omnitrophota bacterium]